MDEKIILLMEETGCEQGEAELALELAEYDLEKAIKTIRTILNNVIAVKGKFIILQENIYGFFISIVDARRENIIRIRAVISYNPVVYEVNLNTDWYVLEKQIYTYRLYEGSVPSFAYEIEKKLYSEIEGQKEQFYKALLNKEIDKIGKVLFNDFSSCGVYFSKHVPEINIVIEEINISEYLQDHVKDESGENVVLSPVDTKKICLEVELYEDDNGKKVVNLEEDDVILAKIIDKRDIGKYLARLLGTKDDEYIQVPVKKVNRTDSYVDIQLDFAPGISGALRLDQNTKVRIIKESEKSDKQTIQSWLKKIFIWKS